MKKHIYISIIFGVLLLTRFSFSQTIKWNDTPKKGFVYEITNLEARDPLLRYRSREKLYDMLHTLVDTFDIKQGWKNKQ
jgi:hypothetical protein